MPIATADCSVGVTGRPSPGTAGPPGAGAGVDGEPAAHPAATRAGTVNLLMRNIGIPVSFATLHDGRPRAESIPPPRPHGRHRNLHKPRGDQGLMMRRSQIFH